MTTSPSPTGPTEPSAASQVRVSSMQVRGLSEALEQAGVTAADFIQRSGLDVARMADAHGWFSLEEFDRLLVLAVELSGDTSFGLHWGERSPMMQFDLAPLLVATASTLQTAIESLLQFQPVLANRIEFGLTQQRDRSVLTCDPLALSELGIRVRTEVVISGLTRLLSYLSAADALLRVNFAYARPANAAEYERLFGELVHFAQPQSGIEFARTALERQHQHRNTDLHQTLRERTAQLSARALSQSSYAEQLERHIRGALPKLLSMSEAARALELSERSLRRRLAEEQLSYSELVDQVQRRLAEEQLSLGTRSIKEVAHALGFSSVSGFHRAYRRWTGSSPARGRLPRART